MADKNLKEARHHGDVGLPVSCYRIQPPYANYEQLECHWHSEMELFKVERGRVQIQCGSDYFEAGAGEMAFFNSGELHAAQPLDAAELDYTAVVFSPEILCGTGSDITRARYVSPVADGRLQISRLITARQGRGKAALEAFDELTRLLLQKPPAYELWVRARLLDIFASLVEDGEACGGEREKSSSQNIKAAIDHIRQNYGRQITIDELAQVSHMSSGHFCRLFKRVTFKTPVQYINSVRLSAAMDMLLQTDRKVLDVALDAGFNSLSYFIGVFKQNLGCTPTEFRSQ